MDACDAVKKCSGREPAQVVATTASTDMPPLTRQRAPALSAPCMLASTWRCAFARTRVVPS